MDWCRILFSYSGHLSPSSCTASRRLCQPLLQVCHNDGEVERLTIAGMNYVSAVYGVIGFVLLVDWFARARSEYRVQGREFVQEAQE